MTFVRKSEVFDWLADITRRVTASPWPLPLDPSDLGELVWARWRAEDLPDGPVASWTDSTGHITATQTTAAKRPIKTGQEVRFVGPQVLSIPFQSRAHHAHRALVLIFKADPATSSQSGGSIFACNGVSGSSNNRQPYVGYSAGGIDVQWRDANSFNGVLSSYADKAAWHVLVSRRYNGVHYASLDGAPEVAVGADICLMANANSSGFIGDFRNTVGFTWSLNEAILLQGQLTEDNAKRLAGWAMWKMGAQTQLPVGHPYRNARPMADPAFAPAAFVESSASEFQATVDYFNGPLLEAHKGEAPNLIGYGMVFEDHFTAMTVGPETAAPSAFNWFSPVHTAALGSAGNGLPIGTVWTQAGSELTVTMQQIAGAWKSGVMCSVNLDGRGRSWTRGYFEFFARCSAGNGKAAWPAFWVKSVNEFSVLTQSRLEIDLYEGYNSDPKGHHQSNHNWPAARVQPGRLATHRFKSNYTGLQPVNLFDNAFHKYGMLIDTQWIIFYFDDKELARYPATIESQQPLFILVDLAMLPAEKALASGTYTMTLDYVRVYQHP